MAKFKSTEFAKGMKVSFAEFKKIFSGTIAEEDLEQAYKIAVPNGRIQKPLKKDKEDSAK